MAVAELTERGVGFRSIKDAGSTRPRRLALSPWRNPRIRSGVASGDLGSSNPITGIAGCAPRPARPPHRQRA